MHFRFLILIMIQENKSDLNKKVLAIFDELSKNIVWQKKMLRDMLIALFCDWHILLEWAPWLAKTLAVSSLSETLNLKFNRIQFTPDLLPSDLIWAKVYNIEKKTFDVNHGPIFSNFVLADEINRAPSKVQSALLEAMAEKQVTIWEDTFKLSDPFVVLATQNPIEQDGTYNLPEAQLDRFLLKTIISYPSREEEIEIMKNNTISSINKLSKILNKKDISEIKKLVKDVKVSDSIYEYVRDLVFYTRESEELSKYLAYWASPRASISLIKSAKALAFLEWRDYVLPEDIKEMIYSVLRHRIILSYEAIADSITTDKIISNILASVSIK